jgi:D-beta-D-heptose 7-phosphate kinase/D-beta-D-heptose 1-phosphate adenosyltransferase
MTILKALECVDWVVPFTEETPLNLIKYLKPNVLVKGADYKTKDIVGSSFVLKNKGEVKTIPLVEGLSTTKKIQRMKNNPS